MQEKYKWMNHLCGYLYKDLRRKDYTKKDEILKEVEGKTFPTKDELANEGIEMLYSAMYLTNWRFFIDMGFGPYEQLEEWYREYLFDCYPDLEERLKSISKDLNYWSFHLSMWYWFSKSMWSWFSEGCQSDLYSRYYAEDVLNAFGGEEALRKGFTDFLVEFYDTYFVDEKLQEVIDMVKNDTNPSDLIYEEDEVES